MRTPEGYQKDRITQYLKSIGAWYAVVSMTGYGKGGTPDIIACIGGQFVAIEVKRPGKEPTERQWTRMREIWNAGGCAVWGDAAKVVNEIATGNWELPRGFQPFREPQK